MRRQLTAVALATPILLGAASDGGRRDPAQPVPPTGPSETGGTDLANETGTCAPHVVEWQTGEDENPTPPTIATAEGALAAAIAASFCSPTWLVTLADGTQHTSSPRPVLAENDALCIATGIVDELGEQRAAEMRFAAAPWHLLWFALYNNQPPQAIDRTEAEVIAHVFEQCSESWKLLLILSVTEGTYMISDASASCASKLLADEDARAILTAEIDRAYDDPAQPDAERFADLIHPLIEVFEKCLTPNELDRLDWN